MANFEVNLCLFGYSEYFKSCKDVMGKNPERDAVAWGDGTNWHEFEPTNNWTHLMPIVVKLGSHSLTILGDVYEATLQQGVKVTTQHGNTPQEALSKCCAVVLKEKDKK